jgi:hypothetical protein
MNLIKVTYSAPFPGAGRRLLTVDAFDRETFAFIDCYGNVVETYCDPYGPSIMRSIFSRFEE